VPDELLAEQRPLHKQQSTYVPQYDVAARKHIESSAPHGQE
jgi:hypothetical protein